jgi:ubiquinol-cytochrome c reductase cytochrome b subunit
MTTKHSTPTGRKAAFGFIFASALLNAVSFGVTIPVLPALIKECRAHVHEVLRARAWILFATFVFFMPNALGHADNYIPADPLVTPAHIVPEWYFLPFYAILRAVPDKLMGVLAMFGAIGCLFALPWLDTSKVKSMRYRPQAQLYFVIFVVTCWILGVAGGKLPDDPVIPHLTTFNFIDADLNSYVWLSRFATLYYFAYFLVVMPVLGLTEKPRPVPETISSPVLGDSDKKD